MRRRGGGVLAGMLAQVLEVHELVVEVAASHPAHDLREILIDRLIGEQALIELALHRFASAVQSRRTTSMPTNSTSSAAAPSCSRPA